MPNPTHTHGFRCNTDGLPFAFVYSWKATQEWTVQLYERDSDDAADLSGITSINYKVFDKPGGTALATGTGSIPTPSNGQIKFGLDSTAFSTATWDQGESLKVYVLTLVAVISSANHAVYDDSGSPFLEFRVYWGASPA